MFYKNKSVTKKRNDEQIKKIVARIRRVHEEQSIPLTKRCRKFGPILIGFYRNLEWEKNKTVLVGKDNLKKTKKVIKRKKSLLKYLFRTLYNKKPRA